MVGSRREMVRGLVQLEVEARDAAGALHHVHELLPMREVGAQHEVVVAASPELEHAGVATDDDRASVRAAGDMLDAGDGTGREVGGHRLPVEEAAEGETQEEAAVGGEAVGLAAPGAQLARRLAEDLLARAVELAQAAEAGGESDLGDGQVGVVEQPAGEVHPRRARQPVGRHADVRVEESAQMPGRDTEPRAQVGLASLVEGAVEDEAHRAADQLRRAPGQGAGLRPAIRAAAMARSVTGGLGGRRERERPHVLGAGRAEQPGRQ